jgi:hypothetical protein
MSYALKMDLEIMLAHLRAMENFDRRTESPIGKISGKPSNKRLLSHGDEMLRCALAGSDPVPTYNCVFLTSPNNAILMLRRPPFVTLPKQSAGWANAHGAAAPSTHADRRAATGC